MAVLTLVIPTDPRIARGLSICARTGAVVVEPAISMESADVRPDTPERTVAAPCNAPKTALVMAFVPRMRLASVTTVLLAMPVPLAFAAAQQSAQHTAVAMMVCVSVWMDGAARVA